MMLDDFMTRAALAGTGVALAAAPLGSFVVWRRMACFGDATAHAAILGVALSLALQISIFAGPAAERAAAGQGQLFRRLFVRDQGLACSAPASATSIRCRICQAKCQVAGAPITRRTR